MTITFILDENDLLQAQLFAVSDRGWTKKPWLFIPFIFYLGFIFFSIQAYNSGHEVLALILPIGGLAYCIFVVFLQKRQFKKRMLKAVREKFGPVLGNANVYTFTANGIEVSGPAQQVELQYRELKNIYETADYFFVKLNSGLLLLFPQSKIDNSDELREALQELSKTYSIPYTTRLNWKF